MTRHAAAIAVAMCLSPAWLGAQGTTFTVTTPSANVHKAPSTGSPVIGKAPRGAVLEVTRELGSWVKIHWPSAPDDVGYVHVSMGSLEGNATPGWNPAPGNPPVRPASDAGSAASSSPSRAADTRGGDQRPGTAAAYVTPTHLAGLGGRVGASTVGVTGRVWSRNGLGVQLEVSGETSESALATDRVRSLQFAPSLIYSLPDRVSYHFWLRPYAGTGATLHRLALQAATPTVDPVSEVRLGLRTFGGAELTFASVPQFALSSDLSYQWVRTAFAGIELGGVGLSVSGHWYVR